MSIGAGPLRPKCVKTAEAVRDATGRPSASRRSRRTSSVRPASSAKRPPGRGPSASTSGASAGTGGMTVWPIARSHA